MSDPDVHPVVRLVGLRETPLDVTEVLDALDDDAAGGLTLFVGRVRDHDGGRGVDGLDYSAHPTALDRLSEVCQRVAAEYDVLGVPGLFGAAEQRGIRVLRLPIVDVSVPTDAQAVYFNGELYRRGDSQRYCGSRRTRCSQ